MMASEGGNGNGSATRANWIPPEWADFLEAFKRYIPRSELEAFKAEIKEQAAKRDEKANAAAGKGGEPATGEPGGGREKPA